jgi:hypothetical protein
MEDGDRPIYVTPLSATVLVVVVVVAVAVKLPSENYLNARYIF